MKILFSFFLLIIGILFFGFSTNNVHVPQESTGPSMKGVCWVGGDSIANHNIDQLCDVGVNWISQTPFGSMSAHDSPEVRLNNTRAWWGERDSGLAHTAELARMQGVKTMLKPHIWLRSRDGKWRSDIEMKNEADWDKWFDNYEYFILHYARLAEMHQIESLCIGTELYLTTKNNPEKWREIIRKIRTVYGGQLTYAANWYKEFEAIKFWDDLDYIGIQGYFPLSKNHYPATSELIKSWNKHKKSIAKVANKYGKKVVFTEIGYKNTSDSAIEPWTWPQQMISDEIALSDQTQENCYQALFESIWQEPWFDGMFIWKWFHTTYRHQDYKAYFAERAERYKRRNENAGRVERPPVYFSPQMNGTLDVLSRHYRTP